MFYSDLHNALTQANTKSFLDLFSHKFRSAITQDHKIVILVLKGHFLSFFHNCDPIWENRA